MYGNNAFFASPGEFQCQEQTSTSDLTWNISYPSVCILPEMKDWALDVLFGSSVATCIVSSDSLPGKPSHSR